MVGNDGVIKISGYSVFEKEGRSPSVAAPARKGQHTYFDTVQLVGKIKLLVNEAVLAAYHQASSPAH
jgi:hypothetical protein